MSSPLDVFFENITKSLSDGTFVKIITSEKKEKKSDLKSISIKKIIIKEGEKLSFTYRYTTKDIVKNFDPSEAIRELQIILRTHFSTLELFTTIENIKLTQDDSGKTKLKKRPPEITLAPDLSHDKQKKRSIQTEGNTALRELGVLGENFQILPSMQDKFKQIDKFLEIIDGLLRQVHLPDSLVVADMWCGKGYLTFAMYDYLVNTLKLSAQVIGIEFRPELVKFCNEVAKKTDFHHLSFRSGTIQNTSTKNTNILIALHACDTATDDAIYQGITATSEIIVCSPCCHKQIRKQMHVPDNLKPLLKNGILEERQAEIVTDAIRALIMESHGYETKVFEYISSEHTGKNLMITGVKTDKKIDTEKILAQIAELKELFGIKEHYLESLFK